MVEDWVQGDQVIYKAYEDYWGEPAAAETAVLRWNQEGAARLVELQSGNVDYITNVSPDDIQTVIDDPDLTLIPVDNPNILYLAMTNTFEPFDNLDVRKAIAMGIDRQRLVDNFYPEGSEVASHFTPCTIPGGCEGEAWYDFDPEAARALLAEAGYPDGRDFPVVEGAMVHKEQAMLDLAEDWYQTLGVEVVWKIVDWGQLLARLDRDPPPLFRISKMMASVFSRNRMALEAASRISSVGAK